MKNRTHGLCILLILSSCFVLSCLAYVELFRGMQHRIQDPHAPEFWQVRSLALQWRNPASEAKKAFASGHFAACQLPDDVTLTDLWIAERDDKPAGNTGVLAAVGTDLLLSTGKSQLNTSVARYRRVANDFTISYNRELVRLMNERR
ncbi:MAG: hypothetical protein ACR2NP_06300 [Pirellulaceae bacterium]